MTWFKPKTMTIDRTDPKIIYDTGRTIAASAATSTGYIIIGVKGNPTKEQIAETIRHEKSHLGHRASPWTTMTGGPGDHLVMVRRELQAYKKERGMSSPTEWNKILPTRIKSFMPYLSWVTKTDQRRIKVQVKQILAPKKGGGNEQAVCQSQADLAQWWIEEEKPPGKCRAVVVRRSIDEITRDLDRVSKGAYSPKPGVGYACGGRLSRKHHRGFKKVRFT